MKLPHFLKHRWSQWSEVYEVPMARIIWDLSGKESSRVSFVEQRQKRYCEVCNLKQERVISGSRNT